MLGALRESKTIRIFRWGQGVPQKSSSAAPAFEARLPAATAPAAMPSSSERREEPSDVSGEPEPAAGTTSCERGFVMNVLLSFRSAPITRAGATFDPKLGRRREGVVSGR